MIHRCHMKMLAGWSSWPEFIESYLESSNEHLGTSLFSLYLVHLTHSPLTSDTYETRQSWCSVSIGCHACHPRPHNFLQIQCIPSPYSPCCTQPLRCASSPKSTLISSQHIWLATYWLLPLLNTRGIQDQSLHVAPSHLLGECHVFLTSLWAQRSGSLLFLLFPTVLIHGRSTILLHLTSSL